MDSDIHTFSGHQGREEGSAASAHGGVRVIHTIGVVHAISKIIEYVRKQRRHIGDSRFHMSTCWT